MLPHPTSSHLTTLSRLTMGDARRTRRRMSGVFCKSDTDGKIIIVFEHCKKAPPTKYHIHALHPLSNPWMIKTIYFGMSCLNGMPQSQLPGAEAPGLHDTNLNTLSFQTPRGQELLGHIKKSSKLKWWLCFSSLLMKRFFLISCATLNWRIFLF